MSHEIKVNGYQPSKWPSRPQMNVDAHEKLAVQPDWDQNDVTAADYIKNRPFYTKMTEQALSGFDGWNASVGGMAPIPKVSVNGVIYENVPELYVNEYTVDYIIGQYKISINMMSREMTIAMKNGDALTGPPPTIEFITIAENVAHIDEKFMPNFINEFNVNNLNAAIIRGGSIESNSSALVVKSVTPNSAKSMWISVDDDGAIKTYDVHGSPTNWATITEVVVKYTSDMLCFCGVSNDYLTFTEAKALYAKNRPYLVFKGEPFITAEITENSITIVYMGKGEDGQYGVQKTTFGGITWKSETT